MQEKLSPSSMADLKTLNAALPANAAIGIIGGGQLGRMLASSAAQLGYRTFVLEPAAECPAAQICNGHIVGAYDDEGALQQLADLCDVVSYEFENVPLAAARVIETRVPLYPPSQALAISQDRLQEKTFLRDHGIDVAPFHNIENVNDLRAALDDFQGGILKTRRFGYDGKGQYVFDTAREDLSHADLAALCDEIGQGPYILEQKIAFQSEFSIIAARGVHGDMAFYDPATNIHEGGILRRSIVPAHLEPLQVKQAQEMVRQLLEALEYVGVIGVEFFQVNTAPDGGLLVNEFAPRVHNSGHWTDKACHVSQFEQHIRAVAGLPLGRVDRHHNCEMENLLGHEGENSAALLHDEKAHLTLYGKKEPRAGRKMGHITRLLAPHL